MAKKTKKTALETLVNDLFKELANCVQFNMMDLGKVFGYATDMAKRASDGSDALTDRMREAARIGMIEAVSKYRVN
jgi:hypothetical protein